MTRIKHCKTLHFPFFPISSLLPPANEFPKVMFTPVFQSFCSRGAGGYLHQCMLGYTPPEQTPPPPSRPPGTDTHTPTADTLPLAQCMLGDFFSYFVLLNHLLKSHFPRWHVNVFYPTRLMYSTIHGFNYCLEN